MLERIDSNTSARYSAFAWRVRIALKEMHMSQVELSEKSGINKQTISFILNDRNTPKLETAVKIAKAVGVSLDWLCGLVD